MFIPARVPSSAVLVAVVVGLVRASLPGVAVERAPAAASSALAAPLLPPPRASSAEALVPVRFKAPPSDPPAVEVWPWPFLDSA